jgi:hypothetical protein
VPTTISNPASFSSVRTAFNTEGYGISTSFLAYAQGAGIVPATAAFNAIGAGTGGDPLQLSQFSGFVVPSPITVNVTNQIISAQFAGYESAFAQARYGLSNLGNAFFQEVGDNFDTERQNIAGEWLVSGNGALISVKATLLSHSDTLYSNLSGVFGSFQPMTGEYEWILESSLAQFQQQDSSVATFRIDLALTSNTNTILDTAEITLEVQTQTA